MRDDITTPILFASIASALALGLLRAPVEAHEENPSSFSYYEHVRPILATHCGGCHRPGGVGPMSLLDYEDAIPWANALKLQLLEATMPPWLPDDGSTPLRHARTLTPEELNILVDWAVGQTPEGDPVAVTESSTPRSASLDGMDWVTQTDEPVVLGEDDYELEACVVFPTGLSDSRALARARFVPGDGGPILLRALAVVGSTCDPRARAVFTWLPDRAEANLVEGAEPLAPGSTLALSLLYRKGWREDGVSISDSPRLGLDFVETAASVESHRIDATRFAVDGPTRLAAVFPVLAPEESGRPFELSVLHADGRRELVLSLESYDEQWREKYVLTTPLPLGAGSEILLSAPGVWLDFLSGELGAVE